MNSEKKRLKWTKRVRRSIVKVADVIEDAEVVLGEMDSFRDVRAELIKILLLMQFKERVIEEKIKEGETLTRIRGIK